MLYHNTEIIVHLGDYVKLKKLFRTSEKGRVFYMPKESEWHKDFESAGFSQWAIEFEKGVLPLIHTGKKFAPRNIKFLARANDNFSGISLNESVEAF